VDLLLKWEYGEEESNQIKEEFKEALTSWCEQWNLTAWWCKLKAHSQLYFWCLFPDEYEKRKAVVPEYVHEPGSERVIGLRPESGFFRLISSNGKKKVPVYKADRDEQHLPEEMIFKFEYTGRWKIELEDHEEWSEFSMGIHDALQEELQNYKKRVDTLAESWNKVEDVDYARLARRILPQSVHGKPETLYDLLGEGPEKSSLHRRTKQLGSILGLKIPGTRK
jgi:hypothetical protein